MLYCGGCSYQLSSEEVEQGRIDTEYLEDNRVKITVECPKCGATVSFSGKLRR